ncbi:Transcription initiation factor IIE alpha subunit family protein [Panicum miliaceum]|uniref:Transcription initiation factor IIE alpha subunit family protein n=1 Tax=Panicum miliaceum TaxID=4540 RepID=A0A3L6PM02_PANMI|nr:Transcription initiation factor IIE alpha subunit family protein [Panicum miliaceum]
MLNIKQKNMIVLLQFLEKEKLLKRELIKRAQVKTIDAVAKKENGTFNMLAGAYCCSDYSQVVDVTRYQLHHMKESLKEKPDCSTMIEDYMCCICKRSYSALDAVHLISNTGNTFRCESCKGELVAQSGDYTSRRESRAKSANMLKSLKVEIPLPNSSAELDGAKFDSSLAGVKVLPMWIVQKGMAEKGEQGSDKNERRLGMKAKRSDGASCGDTYAKKQVL